VTTPQSYPMGTPLGNFNRRIIDGLVNIDGRAKRLKLDHRGFGMLNGVAVVVGNYEWQPLLEQIASFSYCGISFRKETRQGCEFWYAFKKINGKTRKLYCGKSWQFYGPQYFEGIYERFEAMKKE